MKDKTKGKVLVSKYGRRIAHELGGDVPIIQNTHIRTSNYFLTKHHMLRYVT